MHLILLSGGSGKRLWPLSNDVRSKQFIKFFKRKDGSYESMLQRVFRQIRLADPDASVTVATSKSQVSGIRNQLGDSVDVSIEPCRRDTFPAIALATAYLHDVKGIPEEESVVVCPVDPYVEDDYFVCLKRLSDLAKDGDSDLYLMGIRPTYPSGKYGYIIPRTAEEVSTVLMFREKPDVKTAESFIREGALWNGGIFAFRIGYLLKKAHERIAFTDYPDLFLKYDSLEKISFDYAVAEHEKSIGVLRFDGEWKDIGSWNTLTETMSEHAVGNAVMDDTCENVHIINELSMPVLAMGLKDIVISSSPDGILVSDKEQSSFIKPYVDDFDREVMYAEKSWGSYQVLNVEDDSLTIKVTLHAGTRMNYHSHERRDEVWVVLSGNGRTIVDGMEQTVSPGDVITMQAGCRHTVIADEMLKLVEVQLGREISVHDKIKHELGE